MTLQPKDSSQQHSNSFDPLVRPQDDFYGYVNNPWIQRNPIPDDKSRWGAFDELQEDTWKNLKTMYNELQEEARLTAGTIKQQTRDLYYTAMNADDLRGEHLSDIAKVCAEIDAILDDGGASLSAYIGTLQAMGIHMPWRMIVDCDNKDSKKHVLHITQDGLTLPNRDYYLESNKTMQSVRSSYQKHLQKVYAHFPSLAENAQDFSDTVLSFETKLAEHSRSDAALRDVEKNYNKIDFKTLQQTYKNIDWPAYASALGWKPSDQISVGQPDFLHFVDSLMANTPLKSWKIYLKWHFIMCSYGLIDESFAQLKFEFFGKVLSGAKKLTPHWKRAINTVDIAIGPGVGELYAERYFPESSKKQVLDMVEQVTASYATRILKLDWMSEPSKQYALKKLANIHVLIGYPDEWRDFSGLTIGRTSQIANVIAAKRYKNAYFLERLHQPVSRTDWQMNPQTVNAYHDPNRLVICFPAAILKPPFFDPKASLATNLGSIGAVIGHELTHGFDDQGSQYDSEGNVLPWLSPKEKKNFAKRAKIIIDQADEYQVLPGLTLQGDLVIGESLADLGGMEIALEALKAVSTKPDDLRDFFIAYATIERSSIRDEKKREYALSDPHPDAVFRVNSMLEHADDFYETFNVLPQDKLYRTPATRAKIW